MSRTIQIRSNESKTLNALDVAKCTTIGEIVAQTKVSRNFVGPFLRIWTGIGLVEEIAESGYTKFRLTPKGLLYKMVLKEDYRFIVDEIKRLEADVDGLEADTENGDIVSRFKSTIESESDCRFQKYSRIESLAYALALGSQWWPADAPEHRILREVAGLLKAAFPIYSASERDRVTYRGFLDLALRILESTDMAKSFIRSNKLSEVKIRFEEVEIDRKGEPVFRVK
jgi:hypothetical protein